MLRSYMLYPIRIAVSMLLFLAGAANATLIWDGDASKGAGVFANIGGNCASPGTVTAVNDTAQGVVWRFYKPSGLVRCESRGIQVNGESYTFTANNTYYFGWRNRLSITVDNNSIFQWKSYGNHQQNYPVLVKVVGGRMAVMHNPVGGPLTTIWSAPVSANTWYHHALAIHLSSSAGSGWIEFWLNGVKQTLVNGTTRYYGRTLDDINEPKWGIYGAQYTTVNSYFDALKVGTAYSDVGIPSPGATFNGNYRLVARHSGKAVAVQGASTVDGANVIQWTYGGAYKNDEWQINSIGNGYHSILNRHSSKAMVVQSASLDNGANVIQWTYGGASTNDQWAIESVGGGYYRIVNRNSGKVLDVEANQTTDGANVHQWGWNGGSNQQFRIISVP